MRFIKTNFFMPLFYNFVRKVNPLRREEPKKLYLSLKTVNMVRVDEITKRIARRVNIHPDLCRTVLNTWNEEAIELLSNGSSVELGDAGYVYLTASSAGVEDEEEASERLIKNIRGHLAFSKKTKEAFNRADRVNAKVVISGTNLKDYPRDNENP